MHKSFKRSLSLLIIFIFTFNSIVHPVPVRSAKDNYSTLSPSTRFENNEAFEDYTAFVEIRQLVANMYHYSFSKYDLKDSIAKAMAAFDDEEVIVDGAKMLWKELEVKEGRVILPCDEGGSKFNLIFSLSEDGSTLRTVSDKRKDFGGENTSNEFEVSPAIQAHLKADNVVKIRLGDEPHIYRPKFMSENFGSFENPPGDMYTGGGARKDLSHVISESQAGLLNAILVDLVQMHDDTIDPSTLSVGIILGESFVYDHGEGSFSVIHTGVRTRTIWIGELFLKSLLYDSSPAVIKGFLAHEVDHIIDPASAMKFHEQDDYKTNSAKLYYVCKALEEDYDKFYEALGGVVEGLGQRNFPTLDNDANTYPVLDALISHTLMLRRSADLVVHLETLRRRSLGEGDNDDLQDPGTLMVILGRQIEALLEMGIPSEAIASDMIKTLQEQVGDDIGESFFDAVSMLEEEAIRMLGDNPDEASKRMEIHKFLLEEVNARLRGNNRKLEIEMAQKYIRIMRKCVSNLSGRRTPVMTDAETLFETTTKLNDLIEKSEKISGIEAAERIVDLFIKYVESPEVRKFYSQPFMQTDILSLSGRIKYDLAKYRESNKLFNLAVTIVKKRMKQPDSAPIDHYLYAEMEFFKGKIFVQLGKRKDAARSLKTSLREYGGYFDSGPGKVSPSLCGRMVAVYILYSDVLIRLGDMREAEKCLKEAIERLQREKIDEMDEVKGAVASAYCALAQVMAINWSEIRGDLSEIESFVAKAEQLAPGLSQIDLLRGWLSYEKRDMTQCVQALAGMDLSLLTRRDEVLLLRLTLAMALQIYAIEDLEVSRKIAVTARDIIEDLREKKNSVTDDLMLVLEGIENLNQLPIDGVDAVIERQTQLIDKYSRDRVASRMLEEQMVYLQLVKMRKEGARIESFDDKGELTDIGAKILGFFSNGMYDFPGIWTELRWFDDKAMECFIRIVDGLYEDVPGKVGIEEKVNMLSFTGQLGLIETRSIEYIDELKKLRGLAEERSSRKRKTTSSVRKLIKTLNKMIKEAEENLPPEQRVQKVCALITDGDLEQSLEELNGLKTLPTGLLTGDAAAVSSHFESAFKVLLEGDKKYAAGEYPAAINRYREFDAMILSPSIPGEYRIDNNPAAMDRIERSRKMIAAESLYDKEEDDQAVSLCEEVVDEQSGKLIRKIEAVQKATALIATNLKSAERKVKSLMRKYPDDERIKKLREGIEFNVNAEKKRQNIIASRVKEAKEKIAGNRYKDALPHLRAILELDADNSEAVLLWAEACEGMVLTGDSKKALKAVQEMVKKLDENHSSFAAFINLEARARATIVLELLEKHFEIIEKNIKAAELLTEREKKGAYSQIAKRYSSAYEDKVRRALSGRRTVPYGYQRVHRDQETGRIVIGGFYINTEHNGGKEELFLDDCRHAMTRGETYVIRSGDPKNPDQIFLKAVEVGEGSAIFELEGEEDEETAFRQIPRAKGIIEKVQDPSLTNRMVLLREIIYSLSGTMKDSTGPTTGYPLIDASLGLSELSAGTQLNGAVRFRDKLLEADPEQNKAVRAAMTDNNPLTLIQGPPGTGKTRVIVELVRQFIGRGKKVLVVSQSNVAVDNVARRLKVLSDSGEDLPFVRLGNVEASIGPDLREVWERRDELISEIKGGKCAVLGTTNGFILDKEIRDEDYFHDNYDVVIVEEAGRATLAETLFPISKVSGSGRVVMVGDHKQLPAYGIDDGEIEAIIYELLRVAGKKGRSREEKKLKSIFSRENVRIFKTSLFESLWEHFDKIDEAVQKHLLLTNRRSHPIIARLVNDLFYGMLKEDPAKDPTPETDTLKVIDYSRSWQGDAACERRVDSSLMNLNEVNIILSEMDRFLNQKKPRAPGYEEGGYRYSPKDITIITPYKAQISAIRHAFEMKAVINDIYYGELSAEEAFSEEKIKKLWQRLHPRADSRAIARARRALNDARKAYETGDLDKARRLLNDVTRVLLFKIDIRRLDRSITWDQLKQIGLFEVETVDSIQGSENKVVILSLVRSNRFGDIGFLGTEDGMNRLNVAYSRAMEKLTIIGDFTKTLTKADSRKRKSHRKGDPAERDNIARARSIFIKTLEHFKKARALARSSSSGAKAQAVDVSDSPGDDASHDEQDDPSGKDKSPAKKGIDLKREEKVAYLTRDELKRRNAAVYGDDKEIIIGIGTSWIPSGSADRQSRAIQGLLNALCDPQLFPKITVVRAESGRELAREIQKARKDKRVPDSNVIIIDAEGIVNGRAYDTFRQSPTVGNRAFFAKIKPPKGGLVGNSYISIVEMLGISLKQAFGSTLNVDGKYVSCSKGDNIREIILTIKSYPYSYEDLEKAYSLQEYIISNA